MPRYIDADKLHVYSYEFPTLSKSRKARIPMVFYREIQDAPTISPDEVRGVGKWIEERMEIRCSVCGKEYTDEVQCHSSYGWPWEYCPNCGAKMEVTQDEN